VTHLASYQLVEQSLVSERSFAVRHTLVVLPPPDRRSGVACCFSDLRDGDPRALTYRSCGPTPRQIAKHRELCYLCCVHTGSQPTFRDTPVTRIPLCGFAGFRDRQDLTGLSHSLSMSVWRTRSERR